MLMWRTIDFAKRNLSQWGQCCLVRVASSDLKNKKKYVKNEARKEAMLVEEVLDTWRGEGQAHTQGEQSYTSHGLDYST